MQTIKKFPEDKSSFPIDKTNMNRCLFSGLYEETVEIRGKTRVFLTYLTPGLEYDKNCVIIAPPSGISPEQFLEDGFWLDFADRENVFLHLLVPENRKWNDDGLDADYMNKVYVEIQSRKNYVVIQDNVYAVGIGDGAVIAQQAVMKMTSEWSGLATFGDLTDKAMLNAEVTHKSENMGKVELVVSASKCQLPVWMLWGDHTGSNREVSSYWKKQNNSDEEVYSSHFADEIYMPVTCIKKSQINEEQIAQVRITNHFSGTITREIFDAVWSYIGKARRHRNFGAKALRYNKNPEEYGAVRHTIEVDGFTRVWYEYVPERVKSGIGPVPLVTVHHGRGSSAEAFFDISGMSCVAEERDFIVCFPEAGIYQQGPGRLKNLLLWNGSYEGEKIDDVAFIRKMIEDVKSRHEIDVTRIYACGQSSGGMMSSELALKAPDIFAAVSPWSALKDPGHEVPLPKSIDPPVPYLFLFGESDWLCADREQGYLEYKVTKDIADFLENLMKLYDLDEKPRQYKCGEISYYVYLNKKRIPMLIVGSVRDMSHANYPRESWIAYDEFLSKFSKLEDGTLLYMGEKVE
ncbi:PHB depolymerase family esterase [Clostridium sp. MCC353]|uniref:alpha/beta hydrolase family esterase n=1 Tax=Clostridium sp. MCC353 TaxID=2592646 RepID=UPI001C02E9C1|nr:PHB depolymerase family esterase [Clostridium sp. MCC353]